MQQRYAISDSPVTQLRFKDMPISAKTNWAPSSPNPFKRPTGHLSPPNLVQKTNWAPVTPELFQKTSWAPITHEPFRKICNKHMQ